MDILNTISNVINFAQNPVTSTITMLLGGGSVAFSIFKLADKAVDAYLKRLDPDKFFIRLRNKAELFADWMVKGIVFFDDRLIDPVKRKLPKTGIQLEDLIVGRIDEIEAIFIKAFRKAKQMVRDNTIS